MDFRTGFGYDVHALVEGSGLVLGGILIEHYKTALGHSDADVLLHAICDALLGAANLGDIGSHFPPDDIRYKGIDSKLLLAEVMSLLDKNAFSIGNVDSTVVLQHPKISSYIPEMRKVISSVMRVEMDRISIKATTTEHLGYIGKEEGIAAYATVLILKG